MSTVCLMPTNPTNWTELFSLARLLAGQGRARPVMLLPGERGGQYAAECQKAGVAFETLADLDPAEDIAPGRNPLAVLAGKLRPRSLLRSLRWRLQGPVSEFKPRQEQAGRRLAHQFQAVASALERHRPAVVVMGDERAPFWSQPMFKACGQRGIPTLIPAISFVPDRRALAVRRVSPLHDAGRFPRLLRAFPEQAARDDAAQRSVFFYPAPVMCALAEMEMLPPRPWVYGGGRADLILTESRVAKTRFEKEGAEPGRILVTGHLAHDELYQRLRAARGQSGKDAGPNRRVVMALPQLAEQGTLDWDSHWREIRFLCQTVRDLAGDCLVSLHPKMDPRRYRFVESEYGLTIATERLFNVLPSAHVFLATYSSTVQWATLCGIPAIIFDFYGFAYHEWNFLSGVLRVTDKRVFADSLRRLLSDEAFYRRMSQEQLRWAPELSPFDGRCAQRSLDAVYELGNIPAQAEPAGQPSTGHARDAAA